MKKKYFSILFLLWAIIASSMYAQIQKIGIPEIEYFNRRQYAGATQNWDIQQASTGFVYFANNECLLEYDGVNWNMIDRMSGNIVRSVSEIGNRLYTGSFEEFGYFEYDSIQQLSYNSLWDKDIPEGLGDIWDIHSWNGEVVLRTEHSLVFINNDKLAKIISAPLRFTSSYVVNGLLLVHDEEEGLMEVRGDKVFPVAGGEVFIGKEITSILPASDNSFVIGTIRAGLFLWDMRGVVKWNVEADPLLKITNIFCGLKYNNDFMVFGTIQGGVVVVDMQGKVFMQIDKDKGLNNNTVLSLTVDREGNIWGGLDNGIVRINFNSSVSFLQGYYNLGTGYCLEKYNDDLYFGTNQALFKISASKFSDPLKTRDDFKRLANTDGQVWALYHDQNSLLCGHNFGAFDISNGTAKKITPGGINGVWNFKPVPGRPDLILSGTYQGICVFQKREGKWLFKSKIEGFDESSRYMEWDDKGNLWVSHGFKGVFSLRFDNDFTAVTRADSFTRDSFPGNRASLVLSKVRGMCVFSGFDGIYRLASDSSTFEREELYDAFFDAGRFPKFLKEDKYNNIWYFSDNSVGVLRYMEDGTYRKVVNPFLPLERKLVGGFEFVFVQDRQNALFGIEDGFAHYSSYDKKNYQIPFNVHVRSFKELSDTISYSFNSVKSGPLPQIVMPVFKFRNNTFDVSYAASFLEGSGMRYSTYLKGFDQAYSDWSESKTRTFANLHEGIYTFGVKAKNRYGVEAEPVYFSFEVLPPWYRTLYAKMAYLLLSIGLILILMFFINRRIVLSRLKEEAKQKEHFRAKEEQLKNAALLSEKEMIKMRNDKLRSEIVYKKKELANSALHLIQKNEVLSDIKLRLKKISKVPAASGINNEVNAIIKKINRELVDENNWDVFEMHFDQVHEEFLRKLTQQHPDLSQREQKLSAFIKMGMSSKEIAALMNVTTRAVENNRYKLRLKLGLDKGDNLSAYIASL